MKSLIYKKKTLTRLQTKNNLLGKNYNIITLLNIRIIMCLLLFSIIWLCFDLGIIIAPFITIIFYYVIEYLFFDLRISIRKRNLEHEAKIYFSLFIIALKSKKNILETIEKLSNNVDNELSVEFKRVLKDMKVGKSLEDALTDMKQRIPSDIINSMLLAIIESKGNTAILIDSLSIQLKHLKDKIIQDAKYSINLIPVKMNITSIIFIVILGGFIFYSLKILEFI